MNKRFATLTAVFAIALLATLSSPVPAEAQVVKIENAGEALVFYPAVETRMLTLTVTGPCSFEYRARSEKGRVVFELTDEAFDGSYNFTVDAVPVIGDKVMEILTEARKTGENGRVRELCRDGKLPTGPTSQSGGFQVVERKIVLDTRPESSRGERDDGKKAAELRPEPATVAGDELAEGYRAEDRDAVTETTLLASATDPVECRWARMRPGGGFSGR